MSTFNRGLDEAFVQALNEQYDAENGWWRQFVDDKDLFLAIRDNAVHVYYRGCRLIEVAWRNEKIVANTHYKYLLRSSMEKEYVQVVDGAPRVVVASAYFADQLNVDELKRSAERYVGDEKKGVHDILQHNPYVLDVEVAISDGERAPRVDFAALQEGEAKQAHIVFYEAKHFDNPELRSRNTPKVVEQIDTYRELLVQKSCEVVESYRRVSKNLCELDGVSGRHPDRHRLLQQTGGNLIIEEEPRLVVFGFDEDQKSGAVWGKHRRNLEQLLHKEPILRGSAAGMQIPTD